MIPLFLKSLLGALAVLVIALLAQSRNFFIAGLIPLFPTFSLIAHYIVGAERSGADLQKTALFGLWSLVPYAAYLLVVYYGSVRWPLPLTLGAATAAWVLIALATLWLWVSVYPQAA